MTALDIAITGAACRVLARRAHALRDRAAGLITTIDDGRGRTVRIVAPEAVTMLNTAAFLDECAADLMEAAHAR